MEFGKYEVGAGWRPLVDEAISIIKKWNEEHPNKAPIKIYQIKEKYGQLRISVLSAPKEIFDKIEELEERSYTICENCGATENVTTDETHGWVFTLCDKCRRQEERDWLEKWTKYNEEHGRRKEK